MGGLNIKIKAPKISLPKINVPKAIDPSRAIKGTIKGLDRGIKGTTSSIKRSDVGVLTTAVAKGATGQKLNARENKAIQTGAKVGAVAAGGYLLATTSAGAAVVGGIKSAGAYVAANPLSTAVVAGQLAKGNTQGAMEVASQMPEYDSGIQMPELGDSIKGNLDTLPSLLINNESGKKPTLASTSTQEPRVRIKNQEPSQPQAQSTVAQASTPQQNRLMLPLIFVGTLIALKVFKVF